MAYIKRQCKNKNCQRSFSTQDARKVYCTRQCSSNWRGRNKYHRDHKVLMAVKRAEKAARREAVVTA